MHISKVAKSIVFFILAAHFASADALELNDAIGNAINNPETPFKLDVFCTNAQSRRSLIVFQGRIGVWNGERQVKLREDDRRALLQHLLDAGFAGFDTRYGGLKKADKQEAPFRAICRVSIEIAGIEKTSLQGRDGEQSPDLLGLAAALLDRIEPRATDGIVASSLEDGLVKLANGVLEPELLEVRFLRLREEGGEVAGFIQRVRGGEISRQPYAPGQLVGEIDTRPLDLCVLREIVNALVDAKVWDLPRNLRYEGTTEVEVAVLGFRYSVAARSSFRSADEDTQVRFGRMLERIESLWAD